jgi:hypothetical protein
MKIRWSRKMSVRLIMRRFEEMFIIDGMDNDDEEVSNMKDQLVLNATLT